MNTVNYNERKNYVKYDGSHYLLYLNEEKAEITNEETGETSEGYSYTGYQPDGSTLIEAAGVTDENRRAKFVAGLIGNEFDMDAQVAILANNGDTTEHAEEMERFKSYRAACKAAVDELLGREL